MEIDDVVVVEAVCRAASITVVLKEEGAVAGHVDIRDARVDLYAETLENDLCDADGNGVGAAVENPSAGDFQRRPTKIVDWFLPFAPKTPLLVPVGTALSQFVGFE